MLAIPTLSDAIAAYGTWDGTFEAHLTVETDDRAAFEARCRTLGVKCILIELADGVHRSQPMTASHHRGELARDVVPAVTALAGALAAAGFPVIRVKLEALALDRGVPVDDAAAARAAGYFEFHAKVRIANDAELAPIAALCARHGAHLSRNDRTRDARGVAERFITLRAHGVGRVRAEAGFDALLAELTLPVISTKREYTVFDGRAELDAGWLP